MTALRSTPGASRGEEDLPHMQKNSGIAGLHTAPAMPFKKMVPATGCVGI